MRLLRSIFVLSLVTASASFAKVDAPTSQPAAPMYVEVYVHGDKHDAKVSGKLGEHDDDHLVIDAPGGTRDLKWDDLTVSSAFTLKSRLIDKASAGEWLSLGTWGWERGLEQQGRVALMTARKMDASLASDVDAVLAVKCGSKSVPPTSAAPAATPTAGSVPAEPKGPDKAKDDSSEDSKGEGKSAGDKDDVAKLTPGFDAAKKITHYTPPTADDITKSLARSRKFADKVRALTKVDLVELETPHFLIYTNWDPREYGFLKDKCEGAYRVLAKQFALKPEDNVFVGKLPIYMFAKPSEFSTFAAKMDRFRSSATLLGYFIPADEIGHMAMWKPAIGEGIGAGQSLDDAKRRWARTLVHEFSHAFLNRYKSNANIPRWMNEGLAEVIAESELPTNNYHSHARELAMHQVDINGLFDDTNMPTGAAYPVMMTMVEFLVKQDTKKFVALVNAIKDGADPEDALEQQFGMRYPKFAEAWEKYARALK